MGFRIKGFFIGILLIAFFTLVIAAMTGDLIKASSGLECNYGCALSALLNAYKSLWFIVLFGLFWFLGNIIAKLSSLINEKDKIIRPIIEKDKNKKFKMLWEHQLSRVED